MVEFKRPLELVMEICARSEHLYHKEEMLFVNFL